MTEAAIPAATLVVWRDPVPLAAGRPEILVVERSADMVFAAGAIVFPGGRIDPEDHALAVSLGHPDAAAKVTAIRETIEESAVAIGLAQPMDHALGAMLQEALIAGDAFGELLARHGLTLDLDALTAFARWMPAFKHARRFDTHFFIAPCACG